MDGAGVTSCGAPQCTPATVWTCETAAQCPGDTPVCCITAEKKKDVFSKVCTDYEALTSATSVCKNTLENCKQNDQWNTCTGGGDCQSNDCVQREVVTKEGLRVVLHVCEQTF